MACENRAGSLWYYPMGMDKIKRETSKQFLDCQTLKKKKERNKRITAPILLEIFQDSTSIGKFFPAREKIPVTVDAHAVEWRFKLSSSRMRGQNMNVVVFRQTPT
ncbi:MAG: hypothetical protein ABF291_06905 [Desulfobacterales bacterium]